MNQERKDRLQSIRQRMSNLSESEKAELTNRGQIATVEGRVLSLHNTIMVYLQSNGQAYNSRWLSPVAESWPTS